MQVEPESPARLPVYELNGLVSRASALISMYEKHANSAVRSPAELEHVQREMKAIKSEILSDLMRSRGMLQKLQKG